MSKSGPLKAPSAQAIEVFEKVFENDPNADMRAIPNQWLLNERELCQKLFDEIELLRNALRGIRNGSVDADEDDKDALTYMDIRLIADAALKGKKYDPFETTGESE